MTKQEYKDLIRMLDALRKSGERIESDLRRYWSRLQACDTAVKIIAKQDLVAPTRISISR